MLSKSINMKMRYIFFLLHLCRGQDIVCELQTSYLEKICYSYDYQSPACGPYLQNCPVIGVAYDIRCSTYVCKVIAICLGKITSI